MLARRAAGVSTRQVPSGRDDRPFFSSSHISLVENGITTPSRELVESYTAFTDEAGKLWALYDLMMAAAGEAGRRRRGVEGSRDTEAPRSLDEQTDRRDVQRHYVVESSSTEFFFTESGALREVLCSAWLRAISPDVRFCYAGHSYPVDPRRGVLRIEAVHGVDVAATRESDNGTVQSFFRLHRSLSPAEVDPYHLRYRIVVDSTMRSIPRLRFQAEAGNHQLALRAVFTPPAVPRQIWWVEAPGAIDADYVPGDRVIELVEAESSRRFDNLVPGWLYGLGWEW